MEIFRIQSKSDPRRGPYGDSLFRTAPAKQSYIVAKAELKPTPYDPPAPWNDGLPVHTREEFAQRYAGAYNHAFASLEQYEQWFVDEPIRRAVFMDSDMVLVKITIDDDKVVTARHQVLFRFEDVKKVVRVPMKKAID